MENKYLEKIAGMQSALVSAAKNMHPGDIAKAKLGGYNPMKHISSPSTPSVSLGQSFRIPEHTSMSPEHLAQVRQLNSQLHT